MQKPGEYTKSLLRILQWTWKLSLHRGKFQGNEHWVSEYEIPIPAIVNGTEGLYLHTGISPRYSEEGVIVKVKKNLGLIYSLIGIFYSL